MIRAFNRDKPYDRFVKEQLAGDELDPSDPEMVVATGFLRMGFRGGPRWSPRRWLAKLTWMMSSTAWARRFLSLPLRLRQVS